MRKKHEKTDNKFKKFFDFSEIENEYDLQIQEKFLAKINYLIDEGILVVPEEKKKGSKNSCQKEKK
jgi:hypothetical protein